MHSFIFDVSFVVGGDIVNVQGNRACAANNEQTEHTNTVNCASQPFCLFSCELIVSCETGFDLAI